MRDRLIGFVKDSLVKNINYTCRLAENIADDLLANGVIVPPVKVGQTVYCVIDDIDRVLSGEVYEIINREGHIFFRYIRNGYYTGGADLSQIGKTVFLTREEAEQALLRGSE